MGNKTVTIFVEGMTCSSCEARIERALLAIPGVLRAKASRRGGEVVFEYDDSIASVEIAKAAIEKAGYTVKDKRNASTLIALGIGLVLAAAYMVASSAGLFNAIPKIDASIGYGMLFVVGLLTSVHCVAMCGGISLSQSIKASAASPMDAGPKTAQARSSLDRLAPGLLYNGGRVISYTIIGGIVGALGSAFNFSPTVKGAIAGAAGLFMLYLGLKMLGLVPPLPKAARLLPSAIWKRLDGARHAAAGRGPFAVGLLNGLMPCGPLQTMQLYALGTGSFFAGALSMFIFSIGTVPLMLGFGLAATLLPRRFLPVMVKVSAVLVMFLGVVTFSRAASLAGIALPSFGSNGGAALASGVGAVRVPATGPASASDGIVGTMTVSNKKSSGLVAKLENGVQRVTTEFKGGYYVPFTVQAGVPVRWTIRVTEDELNGCNNPVTIPAYGISKTLVAGDNLVEFTPKKTGTIAYTCWMGMISSRINVVKEISSASVTDNSTSSSDGSVIAIPDGPQGSADQGSRLQGLLGATGGGGCCSGTSNPAFAGGRVPTETIGMPIVKDGVQEITITVDNRGNTPAAIVLQRGMKAVIKFKASQLTSCNNVVVFPEYNGGSTFRKASSRRPRSRSRRTSPSSAGWECSMAT
jgi:uncharacterized protein